jgi:hypothetical protein
MWRGFAGGVATYQPIEASDDLTELLREDEPR